MEYTLGEKLDIMGQVLLKMGIEIGIPVVIGMVLVLAVPGFFRGLLNPKTVPVSRRKHKANRSVR